MRTVVCVKYSLDVGEIRTDPSTRKPILEGVPRKINDADKNALEEAARLKQKHGGSVRIVSYGPLESGAVFNQAVAIGADEAYVVEDSLAGQLDTAATAFVLAAAIRKLGEYDLVLCGEATIDGFSSQVGPRLAERLGIPQICYARKLSVEDGYVVGERDLEDGYETVRAPMPVLVSVTMELNIPRMPTLLEVLRAKKQVHVWKLEDIGLSRERIQEISSIAPTGLQGTVMARKEKIIKDKPATDAVEMIVEKMIQDKVITPRAR